MIVAYSWCRRRRWPPMNLEYTKVSESGIVPIRYIWISKPVIYKVLFTWPAVSHSCSLTVRSSKYIVLLRKSMPIVAWYVLSNVSYINLEIDNYNNSPRLDNFDAPGNKTRFPNALVAKQNDFRSFRRWWREVCRDWCRSGIWHWGDTEKVSLLERNAKPVIRSSSCRPSC